eukprot:TRINITY_DN2367_c0_g2_i3.p1 TRINITY_DN2367_c0_g2~~TRINITY_DN2367_c0_g2_i3.p1  ORF type:complete len:393 (-),score=66.27 TRINITY_DN2367_c0_g2_i3:1015-2193(-)
MAAQVLDGHTVTLPPDCWGEIFALLPPWYRSVLSLVCHSFADVARSASFAPVLAIGGFMAKPTFVNLRTATKAALFPAPRERLGILGDVGIHPAGCSFFKGRLFCQKKVWMRQSAVRLQGSIPEGPVLDTGAFDLQWLDPLSGKSGALGISCGTSFTKLLPDTNGLWCFAPERDVLAWIPLAPHATFQYTPLIRDTPFSSVFIHNGDLYAVGHVPYIGIYRYQHNPKRNTYERHDRSSWCEIAHMDVPQSASDCFRLVSQSVYSRGRVVCVVEPPGGKPSLPSRFLRYDMETNQWDELASACCTQLFAACGQIYLLPDLSSDESQTRPIPPPFEVPVYGPMWRRLCVYDEAARQWQKLNIGLERRERIEVIDSDQVTPFRPSENFFEPVHGS